MIDKVNRAIASGLTVTECARQIGIKQPSLFNLLCGKRGGRIDTFEKIQAWKPKKVI
jgi:hypothetical protein